VFRVQGVGFIGKRLLSRDMGSRFMVQCIWFNVQGFRCKVYGAGFKVHGSGLRV
jgi:hypothetical protein